MLKEAYLFDASWVFFAGWTILLVALSVIAFGRNMVVTYLRSGDRN